MASPLSVSPSLLTPVTQPKTPTAGAGFQPPTGLDADKARARTKDVAQKFESQFLSIMVQQMFSGVETDGPFGGGFGEEMFRSVLTEEMSKQMTKAGGIGLSDTVQREMLKMQGLN